MAFLNAEEIARIGFSSCGKNVYISNKASFYGASNIQIGDNVRIDDFCVLSAGEGGIVIGNYVHIAVYSSLIGAGKITLKNFSNISSRVSIYSSSDDYSGEYMTNPLIPEKYTNITKEDVNIGEHVIIGSGSVVLPGVELKKGCAVGALSLVKNSFEEYAVIVGIPAEKISDRVREVEKLQMSFEKVNNMSNMP